MTNSSQTSSFKGKSRGILCPILATNPGRDPNVVPEDNHIYRNDTGELDQIPFIWEGISLPCHSYYDVLTIILSILWRARIGATRQSHHLVLLIILAKFMTVVAGDKAKTIAPNLVSTMFTDEVINADGLNIIMGATIPTHKFLQEEIRQNRLHESWDRWPCGQCAETVALVLLKR